MEKLTKQELTLEEINKKLLTIEKFTEVTENKDLKELFSSVIDLVDEYVGFIDRINKLESLLSAKDAEVQRLSQIAKY